MDNNTKSLAAIFAAASILLAAAAFMTDCRIVSVLIAIASGFEAGCCVNSVSNHIFEKELEEVRQLAQKWELEDSAHEK